MRTCFRSQGASSSDAQCHVPATQPSTKHTDKRNAETVWSFRPLARTPASGVRQVLWGRNAHTNKKCNDHCMQQRLTDRPPRPRRRLYTKAASRGKPSAAQQHGACANRRCMFASEYVRNPLRTRSRIQDKNCGNAQHLMRVRARMAVSAHTRDGGSVHEFAHMHAKVYGRSAAINFCARLITCDLELASREARGRE